jgi:CRP/FNR family transcriptional regulator, cyclic AMP receptor protein
MSHWDAIGYFAAGMVFVAFGMKEMVPLRIVGMFSNMAFIAYGLGLDLTPVWLLHAVLLPLNGWRLAQALRSAGRTVGIDPGAGKSGPVRRPWPYPSMPPPPSR